MAGQYNPEGKALPGLRVFIVEDEPLVSVLIEDYLGELGCTVAGSATRLGKALDTLKSLEIDAAVLDINVAGESSLPVAELLSEKSIPFIIASGYGTRGIDPRWANRPVLQKPFTASDLQKALLSCLQPISPS